MNKKEIEKLQKELREIGFKNFTKEQKLLDTELSCREMIMSCLIYGYDLDSHYITNYYEKLGKKRVQELCKEQEKYFNSKCKVVKNVYTDSEGVSYNTLIEEE